MHSKFTLDCMFNIYFAVGDAPPEGCDSSVDNMYDGAINVAGHVCPVEASGLVP